MRHSIEKIKVINFFKAIENGNHISFSSACSISFKQHNPNINDGVLGYIKAIERLTKGSVKVNVIRLFQDGNYVFAHTEYDFKGPKIAGFDIFRFENELIVEHWDNLQQIPLNLNPSGRSMLDGVIKVEDLEKSKSNKILVTSFVNEIFVKGNLYRISDYFNGDSYIQHNPQIPDNLSGLIATLAEFATEGIFIKYNKIHFALAEGNYVLVVSEGYFGKDHDAFYDLFRVENGKIAEHWDVIEKISNKDKWKNNNGKFNFYNDY